VSGNFVPTGKIRIPFHFFFLFTLIFASGLTSPAEAAREGVVEKISIEGLFSAGREEILDLLEIKTGEALDPLKVRNGIKRAFLKGIFDDIEVHSDAGRTEVRVFVKERDRIRKISVEGNEHFSGREIRSMFPLKEDWVLRYDLLDDSVMKLRSAMAERGFLRAVASVGISDSSKPYWKDLTITVGEGKPLLINRIVVSGAPDKDIRDLMRTGEGDIYDRDVLTKNMNKIRELYKKQGYLNPVVSHIFSDGGLSIDVGTGKKLKVNFEGNSVFSSRRLMKEMPFFDAGEVRDYLVEDAARKITSLYFNKGYAFVQVAPVMSEADVETLNLTFFIFEGERVEVGTLTFPGMTLNEKNLKEVLPLKEGDDYNPELVSSDVEVVREFYIALGYLGVEVGAPDVRTEKGTAIITIPVREEGPRTLIDSVEITGARSIHYEEILKAAALKTGNPYNEVDISDGRLRVLDLYQEMGFLDVTVDPKVDLAGEKAQIIFEIQEGEKTFFGKTIIAGNTATRSKVLEREFLHKESSPLNYGVLARERQRLFKLGLFTDVRTEILEPYDHRRDILIEVVEGDAGSVEFGFGYSNFDKFTGFVDIGYRNLFGMNRQVSLRIGYNALEKLYAVNYLDPWFLDRPLQLKSTVFLNERDEKNIDTKVIMYRYRKQGVSLGVEKQYGNTVKGELYLDYVLAETFGVQPDIILTGKDTGKLAVGSVRPGITYDTRDNPFDPRNGIVAGVTLKLASSALLSETSFAKVVFNGSLYHEISKAFVLAAAFRFGVAHAWGSSEVLPLVERFFLGGRGTVRGYAQDTLGPRGAGGNPTGGNAFIGTNLELRTSLGKGIGLVTFLDSGNVWQRVGDLDWSMKHAVGLGLRYNTPVGPVRIDYGYKLRKEDGLSRSEIFFSIGQAF
jgi:outer membrane protein insertion porin family